MCKFSLPKSPSRLFLRWRVGRHSYQPCADPCQTRTFTSTSCRTALNAPSVWLFPPLSGPQSSQPPKKDSNFVLRKRAMCLDALLRRPNGTKSKLMSDAQKRRPKGVCVACRQQSPDFSDGDCVDGTHPFSNVSIREYRSFMNTRNSPRLSL